MKIRQGFVSNSSSSSFIAIGINLKKEEQTKELLDFLKKNNNKFDLHGEYLDEDFEWRDNCSYKVRETIASHIEEGDEGQENISEINKNILNLKEKFNLKNEPFIFWGNDAC